MTTLLLMLFNPPSAATCSWPLTMTVFPPENAKALATAPERMPPGLTVMGGSAMPEEPRLSTPRLLTVAAAEAVRLPLDPIFIVPARLRAVVCSVPLPRFNTPVALTTVPDRAGDGEGAAAEIERIQSADARTKRHPQNACRDRRSRNRSRPRRALNNRVRGRSEARCDAQGIDIEIAGTRATAIVNGFHSAATDVRAAPIAAGTPGQPVASAGPGDDVRPRTDQLLCTPGDGPPIVQARNGKLPLLLSVVLSKATGMRFTVPTVAKVVAFWTDPIVPPPACITNVDPLFSVSALLKFNELPRAGLRLPLTTVAPATVPAAASVPLAPTVTAPTPASAPLLRPRVPLVMFVAPV